VAEGIVVSEAASSSLRHILGEEAWLKFCNVMSTRSKQGLRALAAKGKWPNASPPLGYIKARDADIKVNHAEVSIRYLDFSYFSLS